MIIDYINYLKSNIEQPQCMMMFLLLRLKFKNAEPYYDNDHVITKINNKYYDWTGEVNIGSHIPFEDNYGDNWIIEHHNSIFQKDFL
jgi:hypothetical protein